MRGNFLSPGILAAAGSAALLGCASQFTTVAPQPPQQYSRLGEATGSACGSLGIFGTASYFVPMGINGRVANAYKNAVDSVPGATALVDVTIQEHWAWWLFATSRCVTVTGEAIK
jgi:hypothetical protein